MNSVWDECGRSALDGAKRPKAEERFPQRHVAMCCDAIFRAFVLHRPSLLHPNNCMAEKKSFEEKLVSQQEITPQENPRR